MVELEKIAMATLMGSIAIGEDQANIKVSLFIISRKFPSLKKINLGHLTSQERADKLRKWGQEYRFVAVAEVSDQAFAYTYAKHAERLQAIENLTLNGKKVSIQSLTDEEAQELASIGEIFAQELVNVEEKQKAQKEKKTDQGKQQIFQSVPFSYSLDFARKQLISPHLQMFSIELKIQRGLSKIISNCMQRYAEAQREIQKQKEADDRRFDIKRSEIKKEILKAEIKQNEIQKQELNQSLIKQEMV